MNGKAVVATIGVATLLLIGSVGPVSASHQPDFVVDLDESGDATVTITYTYDLDDDAEQAAFEELRDNETARATFEQRASDRFASIARASENRTGRPMSIESATVELTSESATGVVELSIQWNGLAATTDDGLRVTEPFASGFEPDRQFVIVVPDGHEASVTPAPDERADGRLSWATGTSLDSFELTTTAGDGSSTVTDDASTAADGETTGQSSGDTTGGSGPGFGVVIALVALLGSAVLALRRR